MNKKLCILIILAALTGGLYASGQQEKSASEQSSSEVSSLSSYTGKEGRITVYLSGPAEMLKKLEGSFEADNGDVLDFVQMGCGPLRQRLWAEMEAGQINADVFWGSDPLIYIALEEHGVLEDYTPKGVENLRPELKTDSAYTYISKRYGVVIYNKDKVSEAPIAYHDLLKPEYKNNICHADPAMSSTALALIAGLWELEGYEGSFHRALCSNGLFLTKKNSDVPSKIQEGEYLAGIAPHDAVLRLQKKAKKDGYPTPLAITWPKEGAIAICRPAAISKNESRPEVNEEIAENFMDFLISKDAQTIMNNFGFISVRNDVVNPAGIPAEIETIEPDWTSLSASQESINAEFKKFFK
ncbi:MAG: extracellular solute-binding protein [Spirochaetales bacterium]|nr:extracellular solute-binding protein [Spirochaetales bacterium]